MIKFNIDGQGFFEFLEENCTEEFIFLLDAAIETINDGFESQFLDFKIEETKDFKVYTVIFKVYFDGNLIGFKFIREESFLNRIPKVSSKFIEVAELNYLNSLVGVVK